MFGVKRARLERSDVVHVYERKNLVVIDNVDFAYFVAGAESVEEMKERNARFERGKVSDERKVHNLLYGVGGKHRKTGLTASHYVGVISENVKRVSRKSACAYVEYGGKEFARDLVHIRDHKEQALARRISGGERTRYKRSVYRARCAALGFHLGKFQGLSEHVLSALSRPFVRDLCHRRGGSDGVNGRYFAERIRDMRRRGITVDCHFFHSCPPDNNFFQQ